MTPTVPPLSPRLLAVARAIAPGSRVADLGTDHGRLPLWLAAHGQVAYCLATEKSAARLARAGRAPGTAAWGALLSYRAGDGLKAIRPSDRIDTVVLAGMGGRTIVRLLAAHAAELSTLSRIVIQPRTEPERARRWFSEHGWRTVWEDLAADRGRFHVTLAAERGGDADLYSHTGLSRDDLLAAGPLLVRSGAAEVAQYWRLERARLASILAHLGPSPSVARVRAGIVRSERILAAISTPGG